jgi:hypothetical protein
MARDFEKKKPLEPAFCRVAKPVLPDKSKNPDNPELDPWLKPGKLYKEVRIRVTGGGLITSKPDGVAAS